ncbi:hypothetical protein BGHDH14_bgh01093 [Blumeria hordei DH14]|uniref:Uncharacterized protein n=1 Tax=Blumeria graminis f. sp. hordei (strain DH14) TaxID=546991 RepID=N1J9M2_BLUG1|nr:hypothetical protein BGHDH14_bgh01093 [Blumeria hordei DH14]
MSLYSRSRLKPQSFHQFAMSNNTSTEPGILPLEAPTTATSSTSVSSSSQTTASSQTSVSTHEPSTSPIIVPVNSPTTAPAPEQNPAPNTSPQSPSPAPPQQTDQPSKPEEPDQPGKPAEQPHSTTSIVISNSPTAAANTNAPPIPESSVLVTVTLSPTAPGAPTVVTVFQTSTHIASPNSPTHLSISSSSLATPSAGLQHDSPSAPNGGGIKGGGKIAVAVIVPIFALTLLALAATFFWRHRRQRKDAEELRRKEVEEYGYNPNHDPTFPVLGPSGSDGPAEMQEGIAGYRGWGTTAIPGRQISSTMSAGRMTSDGIGLAYSEGESPTHGTMSDTRSENALIYDRPTSSSEKEPLGALGPAVNADVNANINRGPSNASSSYSITNKSDGSGDGSKEFYNIQNMPGNIYPGESTSGRAEMAAQPVIRDVSARRNTRIESPSHFPQQSAGISQNF